MARIRGSESKDSGLMKRRVDNDVGEESEDNQRKSRRLQNGAAFPGHSDSRGGNDTKTASASFDDETASGCLSYEKRTCSKSSEHSTSEQDCSQENHVDNSQATEENSDCDVPVLHSDTDSQSATEENDVMIQAAGTNNTPGLRIHSDTDSQTATEENDVVVQAAGTNNTPGPSIPLSLQKIISVQADAVRISELLGHVDVASIYKRLKALRKDPNRIEVVTNEVLEAGEEWSVGVQGVVTRSTACGGGNSEEPSGSANANLELIISDISSVVREMKKHHPTLNVDPNVVYTRLENMSHSSDRVQNVIATLLQEENAKHQSALRLTEEVGDIFQQVQRVLKECPQANANRVYNLLEVFSDHPKRIDKVVEHLSKGARDATDTVTEAAAPKEDENIAIPHTIHTNKPETCQVDGPSTSGQNTPVTPVRGDSFKRDPLYQDMQQLADIFPDRTQEEIYAHLEVYHNNPNRIQLVMEEFLQSGASQSYSGTVEVPSDPDTVPEPHAVVSVPDSAPDSQEESDETLRQFRHDVNMLKSVFPDCEHKFIIEQLQYHFDHKTRVDMVTAILMNRNDYPKISKLSESGERRRKLENLTLDVGEFLKMFPDPNDVFYNEKEMSKVYKQHAKAQLYRDYRAWKPKYLDGKLKGHNFHYLPALREIQTDMIIMAPAMQNNMADNVTPEFKKEDWPTEVDEYFYRELLYAKHEDKILKHISTSKEAHERRLQLARNGGELQVCGCCFDDEVLPENMGACKEGHLFCTECISRSVESALSDGKAAYPCLTGDCKMEYQLSLLQEILSSKTFSHVLRRTQEEELRQANISDLVTCPFCPYATVMPDDSDKVLRCLNPDCLKESCRLCREPSHIPLRCDEVEKADEVKMRTFIENRMAEAMMRTCPNCGKRFYKIHGCNKMTCVCGAHMCYVCRKPITDYRHFENNIKCSEGHMDALHNKETNAAAKAAREEYLRNHAEARGITLKHDPTTALDTGHSTARHHYEDSGDSSDDDDDDDDDMEDEDEFDYEEGHYHYYEVDDEEEDEEEEEE